MSDVPASVREKYLGESSGDQWTDQQRALLGRLQSTRLEIASINREFRSRAASVLSVSGVMFSVESLLLGLWGSSPGVWPVTFLVIGFFAFASSVFLSAVAWLPRDGRVVGTSDVKYLYETYLSVDADDAIFKLMLDEAGVFKQERETNGKLARIVAFVVGGAVVQAASLVGLVLSSTAA